MMSTLIFVINVPFDKYMVTDGRGEIRELPFVHRIRAQLLPERGLQIRKNSFGDVIISRGKKLLRP